MSYLVIITLYCINSYASSLQAENILIKHDEVALKIYDQLKNKYISNTDPLLIAQGDQFILYHQGKIRTFSVYSPQYNDLKSVSHVVLATFALFNPLNHFPQNKTAVMQYRKLLIETGNAIVQLPLNKEEKMRQKKIIYLTDEFIQKALRENSCSTGQLEHFFQDIAPLIKLNMRDAVQAQLNTIDKQMIIIEKSLSKEERGKLFVVIPVSKAPRKDNLLGQYFSKRLKAPMDSARLIFAEGLTDKQDILTLVGAWQIEADLSKLFFLNPDSMKKDILGADAKDQLESH
ncbi:hypothetical protein [Legionella sp. km772]|uniref:hypothetical protein n=1 Tax=Legionella sp. km772 TaxID=2498111 RepID=UPI000F8EE7D6|nr:hypothetical protein [Legionella sp. km772]